MKLDATDTAILDLLKDNARVSNREVARVLGMSESMVRQRLKKMTDGKAMRLGLVADMATVGYTAAVIVRLRTIPSKGRAIAEAVAQLECCAFSGLTLGRFDVLIYLIGQTRQELAQLIDERIAPLEGVVDIDVREPVGSAKQRFELVFLN
ncbi:MAG: Lrp/AsnC family transcriptional regulator [Acidovorax sp.]|uniref:Lrp/AsnC family transcriptional regulator n=1 Tax=Acidovorax sp. TaxID=1872122 RepID=UPI00391A24BD